MRWMTRRAKSARPYAVVVSSALVACEIPPWRDYNNVAVTTTVSLYTQGRSAQSTHQSSAAAAFAAASDITSIGTSHSSPSPLSAAAAAASATAAGADAGRPGATLWMEYLPSGTGGNSEMRPARGPVWGGTPVRLGVDGGWVGAAIH